MRPVSLSASVKSTVLVATKCSRISMLAPADMPAAEVCPGFDGFSGTSGSPIEEVKETYSDGIASIAHL